MSMIKMDTLLWKGLAMVEEKEPSPEEVDRYCCVVSQPDPLL